MTVADDNPQPHLGVFYTGVGSQFLWADPTNADHTAIETYVSVARTLERGLFVFSTNSSYEHLGLPWEEN
jgi:hypothetical protein